MSEYEDGSDYRPDLGPPRPGQPPSQRPASAQDPESVAAMVMGLFAILLSLFCGFLAIPVGLGAIVFGVRGRRRSVAAGKRAGLAVAGIALGTVGILLTVGFYVLMAVNTPS